MKFEEILPLLKENKSVKRRFMDGHVSILNCKDGKKRIRILKSGTVNYPYNLNVDDLMATDWMVL